MDCQKLIFSGHAIQQMFWRQITRSDVLAVITFGETIAEYPDDQPYPSRLLLDFVAGCPIHVVVSYNQTTDTCYVVTAYIPNPDLWEADFKTRK